MARVTRRRLLLYTLGGVTATTGGIVGYGKWRTRGERSTLVLKDGPGVSGAGAAIEWRRRLGRTNLDVSVIGIGAGGLGETAPIHRAVDKGMNYIDTSTCYGGSENVIGKAIRESKSLRDKLIIAIKWDPASNTPKERMLASLDESLKRMGVDAIDVMQVHWLGGGHQQNDTGFNRLDNPELYEAMEIAKKSGKVRFFGATSHDANRARILSHAVDKGFDVLLVKMNVLDCETAGLPELLAKAKAKDVGVVVMKSQPGGSVIPNGFEGSKYNIYQANLRWALQHEEVACVVHSATGTDPAAQDLAIGAVQEKLGRADTELLEKYARALSAEYCRSCGACEAECPNGVRVGSVLQFAMYAKQYGWEEQARAHYANLPPQERWSEACTSCHACTDACPYGVDAQRRVAEARRILG
jgi:predicted aldo/keto reductase-like oxidoreductase